MAVDEILSYLFDHQPHVLAAPLAGWMRDSPRFAAFVGTHRDKIRKKIRGIHSADGFQDLRAELETAYLLLREKRFELAYEPYGKGMGRGPDFAVTFKTHTTFNVEVTRMRSLVRENDNGEPAPFDLHVAGARLAETAAGKLRQMLPGMMNLLAVVADDPSMCQVDVDGAMKHVKQRAEQKEPHLFERHSFRDASDFFKYYQRLSGLLLRSAGAYEAGKCPVLWLNNQAKHPLPAAICAILQR